MASVTSNKLRTLLLNAGINLLTDTTIKAMLVTSGYTPAKGDNFASAITGGTSKELSGTGYTAGFGGSGRKALASKAVTQDDTNNWGVFDAADVTWTAINAGTVAHVAIIKEVTADTDSPILCVITLPSTVTTNGGDYTVQWATPATGAIFYIG